MDVRRKLHCKVRADTGLRELPSEHRSNEQVSVGETQFVVAHRGEDRVMRVVGEVLTRTAESLRSGLARSLKPGLFHPLKHKTPHFLRAELIGERPRVEEGP